MAQTGEEQPQSGRSKPAKQFRASSRPSFRGQHVASGHPQSWQSDAEPAPNPSQAPAPKSAPQYRTRRERLEHERRLAAQTSGAAQPTPVEPQSPRERPESVSAGDHVNAQAPETKAPENLDQLRTRSQKSTPGRRHTKERFDAFPKIVGWTSLGTLLPGLAMVQKNRKSFLGWFLLIGFCAGILGLAIAILVMGPIRVMARVISSPTILNLIAILLLVGLLIWMFVILRSYFVTSRGKPMSGSQKVLSGVLVASLMVIVGVPLGIGGAYARVSSHTVSKIFGPSGNDGGQSKEQVWADKPRINVFLIGRDSAENRQGTRPDTMLVASIDTQSGESTLISVPRNLAYPIFPEDSPMADQFPDGFNPYGEESLINAVWTWADENPEAVGDPHGLETGMWATMQAVEGSLGLNLDYWASVDMKGFRDLVNAMGGVQIDVERPIPVGGGNNLHTGGKNPITGWIDPGQQTLSGSQALWYVRSREGSDNYDRMCRQQRMLKTTLEQVNPSELALKFPELANSSTENISTDIRQKELGGFVELAWEMKNTKIKSAQINNEVTPTYQPDYDQLHEWVQDQIDPKQPSQKEDKADDESGDQTDGDTAEPSDEPTDEPSATDEPHKESGAPAPGIENDEGKCYPSGYTPGDPWPGYPGPGNHGGQG